MRNLYSQTIVVYNRRLNPETGADEWSAARIEGASWHCRTQASTETGGLRGGQKVQVRIPTGARCAKAFVPPQHFANPEKEYTLQAGDILALEDPLYPPPQAAVPYPPRQARCHTITAWGNNSHRLLPHLYIEAGI